MQLDDAVTPAALLFGEAQGRIVLSCAEADVKRVLNIALQHGVQARDIGRVAVQHGRFRIRAGNGVAIDAAVEELAGIHRSAIPRLMETGAPVTAIEG